jgi:hypothetical protein
MTLAGSSLITLLLLEEAADCGLAVAAGDEDADDEDEEDADAEAEEEPEAGIALSAAEAAIGKAAISIPSASLTETIS